MNYEQLAREWLAVTVQTYRYDQRVEVVASLAAMLERVAREERERCAKVAENVPRRDTENSITEYHRPDGRRRHPGARGD